MVIQFWGVRGSIPAPLSYEQIKSKIQAVIQRISPKDLENEDTRQLFLSSLPEWLYGTVGGNTSCIELTAECGKKLIFDAGSGIRALGKKLNMSWQDTMYLFFSHFHWDHIQGIPFFDPLYSGTNDVRIFGPLSDIKGILSTQMVSPFFPVTIEAFSNRTSYTAVEDGTKITIGSVEVICKKMSHPGGSYAYRVKENDRIFIYATDVELSMNEFDKTPENAAFFSGADMLVLDAQYTLPEAMEKEHWGHSAFSYAVDFASAWNIKSLYLFHHEPGYNDKKMYSILQSSRQYCDFVLQSPLKVFLAREGDEITV